MHGHKKKRKKNKLGGKNLATQCACRRRATELGNGSPYPNLAHDEEQPPPAPSGGRGRSDATYELYDKQTRCKGGSRLTGR